MELRPSVISLRNTERSSEKPGSSEIHINWGTCFWVIIYINKWMLFPIAKKNNLRACRVDPRWNWRRSTSCACWSATKTLTKFSLNSKSGPTCSKKRRLFFRGLWKIVVPIGSMVLLYMVTWIPSIYQIHVSICIPYMDPMGLFPCGFKCVLPWIHICSLTVRTTNSEQCSTVLSILVNRSSLSTS